MTGLREMVLLKETALKSDTVNEVTKMEEEDVPELVEIKDTKNNDSDGYFTSYDDVQVHQLMIKDKARTDAYQKAIVGNPEFFKDKIVMDVGAGTGILSLFAKKAGAKKVYAVEASPLADVLREIVELNDEEGVIEVIHGKAEDVEIENKVDVIISEWMGFYLLHESMLDSVIAARDKHLSDDGVMLPSHATILSAPVHLDSWVSEQFLDWHQVYGFDMTPMSQRAIELRLMKGQPEVMDLKEENLLSQPVAIGDKLDLRWVQRHEIIKIEDRKFISISKPGNFHGLALWFDVEFSPLLFDDDTPFNRVELKTGPLSTPTHWKQTVLVITENFSSGEVDEDEIVGWEIGMEQSPSNPRQYKLSLQLLDPETEEHPTPCQCQLAKCALVAALLEQEDRDLEELEEITS